MLDEPGTAERIALFMTSHPEGKYTVEEFAKEFGMEKEDAAFFLNWIHKGVAFKKDILDKDRA